MSEYFRVACIGSRDITNEESELCFEIGKFIAQHDKWFLATGNADGADSTYAAGANTINPSSVLLYLPWPQYNADKIVKGNRVLRKPRETWEQVASQYHPAWPHLSQGVKKLMLRNAGIILRAQVVIALLNHKKQGFGGTGHGWRMAEGLGILKVDISGKSVKYLPELQDWLVEIQEEQR